MRIEDLFGLRLPRQFVGGRDLLDAPFQPCRIDIAKPLGDRGIFVWDGNYYALNLTERLGVEEKGGLLRVGIVHYNTADEISRLLNALRELK